MDSLEDQLVLDDDMGSDMVMEPSPEMVRGLLETYEDIPAALFMNLSNVESHPQQFPGTGNCVRLPSIKDLYFSNWDLQSAQLSYGKVHVISCYFDDHPDKRGKRTSSLLSSFILVQVTF